MSKGKILGVVIVFIWFFWGGVMHFINPDFFVAIMPPYIGYHLEIVYILGAIGVLLHATRQWAGNGLILLVLCVTPANVYMWMNPELFSDVPPVALSVRLVIQVILLWLIWWSTRQPKAAIAQ
jgi:uncharacterized membrane protein